MCDRAECPLERTWAASVAYWRAHPELSGVVHWAYRCKLCRRFKRRQFVGGADELILTQDELPRRD